jgi:hypothetical protein
MSANSATRNSAWTAALKYSAVRQKTTFSRKIRCLFYSLFRHARFSDAKTGTGGTPAHPPGYPDRPVQWPFYAAGLIFYLFRLRGSYFCHKIKKPRTTRTYASIAKLEFAWFAWFVVHIFIAK